MEMNVQNYYDFLFRSENKISIFYRVRYENFHLLRTIRGLAPGRTMHDHKMVGSGHMFCVSPLDSQVSLFNK